MPVTLPHQRLPRKEFKDKFECDNPPKGGNTTTWLNRYLIYMTLFCLGFNKVILYAPLLSLILCLNIPTLLNGRISKKFLILLFSTVISILPLVTIGINNLTIKNPLNVAIVMLASVGFVGLIMQYQSQRVKYVAIILYILGVGFEAMVISVYSFLTDPVFYGYGRVLNPFSGEEMNSPQISNNAAILSVFSLYLIMTSRSWIIKVCSVVPLIMTFAAGVFLGGRAFFIIILLSVLPLLVGGVHVKRVLKITLYLAFGIFVPFLLIVQFENLIPHLEFVLSRFENGLESKRWGHYAHGLKQIVHYPLGGFSVDKGFENTNWFHNIFLDNARIAGWLPLFALFFTIFFISKTLLERKDKYYQFGFTVFFAVLLVMMQSVVIEGDFRPLVLMYFVGILMIFSGVSGSGRTSYKSTRAPQHDN